MPIFTRNVLLTAVLILYPLFGTVVYAMFAGFPFRWPKFTGTMLDERLGKITFWTLTVEFRFTFLVQHRLGPPVCPAGTGDPWGYGRSLEWATFCPPPRRNFTSLPRIRGESAAVDLHHPASGELTADRPTAEHRERRGHASGHTANTQQIHREEWTTLD